MLDNDIEVKVGADASGVHAGMNDAVNSIKQSIASMKTEFGGMGSIIDSMKSQLMGMGSIFAGAFAIKHLVDVASEFEQLDIRLKAVMGSSAKGKEAFSWIKQFAVDTPYSVRQVTDSFMMLKNFGLDPMDGTLQKVSDASAKYGNSAETQSRVALALGQAWARGKLQGQDILQMIDAGIPVWELLEKATGKNAAELQKMSEKGQITRVEMVKLVDVMGEVSNGASADKMNSFTGAVSNMGDAFENSIDQMRTNGGFEFITEGILSVTELIPSFMGVFSDACALIGDVLGELWGVVDNVFSAIRDIIGAVFGDGGSALTAMEFTKNAIAVVRIAIIGLSLTFEYTVIIIKGVLAELVAVVMMSFRIIERAIHMDFSGVKTEWKNGMNDIKAIAIQGANDIADAQEKGRNKMLAAMGLGDTVAKVKDHEKVKPTDISGGGNTAKAKKEPSMMPEYKAELEKKIQLEIGYFKESTALELTFWQDKLNVAKLSQKDRLAIDHNIYELKKKLAKDGLSDELAALKYQSDMVQMDGAERVKIAKQIAQRTAEAYGQGSREHIKSIHDIEAAERAAIEVEKDLERQRIDTTTAANNAIVDIEAQRIEQIRSLGIISAVEEVDATMAFEQRKYEIARDAQVKKSALLLKDSVDQKAAYAKMEQDAIAHEVKMSALRNKRLKEERATTIKIANDFKSAMANSFKGILSGTMSIGNAIKNVFKGVFDSIVESMANMAAEWVAKQIMMRLFSQKTAMGEISASAAKAGAAGTASFAGAPWPIDMGAPAFGASMSAAAMAYQGVASSSGFAVGSWNVPEDGIAKIHKGETIMPEKFAEKYRNGDQGGGGATHVHINALDAKSVTELFRNNPNILAPALNRAKRNFSATTSKNSPLARF